MGSLGAAAFGRRIVGFGLKAKVRVVTLDGKNVDIGRKMEVGSDIGWLKSAILPEK
jgi:hypothetical protein